MIMGSITMYPSNKPPLRCQVDSNTIPSASLRNPFFIFWVSSFSRQLFPLLRLLKASGHRSARAMDTGDLTLSGAARAPPLSSSASRMLRAKEPFHVQVIPPTNINHATSPAYVTHLLSLSTSFGVPTLLAVADDSSLTLIDKTTGVIGQSHRAFTDGSRITQAKILPLASSSTNTGSFLASVSNGTVVGWDTRSSGLETTSWVLKGPSRAPYLCVEPNAANPNMVVAGTEMYGHGDSDIDIWDLRSPKAPVSKYNEVHSDDITSLAFHPDATTHAGILLSGSTDGLVSAIDTTINEEDDAVISVGNTGNSVARAGWISQSSSSSADTDMVTRDQDADLDQVEQDLRRRGLGSVWAIGDMQTVSIFDADKFDPTLPTTDVRSSTSLRPPWSTDYVIDGTAVPLSFFPNATVSSEGDGLTLFVGKSEGALAVLNIPIPQAGKPASWTLRAVFPEAGDGTLYGHTDIVRSVEWDPQQNTLYTGGEDGNLCFWKLDDSSASQSVPLYSASSASPAGAMYDSSSGKSSPSAAAGRGAQRYTPYK